MPQVFDAHVHLPTKEFLVDAGGPAVEHGLRYFGTRDPVRSVGRMVEELTAAGIARAVLLAWDAETATQRPPLSNDTVARIAREHADLFVPVASVDPHKGARAVAELERAASRLEMRGLKLHPQMQAFYPDEPRWEPLWRRAEELRLPVVVHTGTSGLGAGSPGGDGIRLDYARPLRLDAVAAAHPDLQLLCAHAGWPWHEELLAMALHKSNVWIDVSGWLAKYLPEVVLQYANGRLSHRFLFGSDYPFLDPERCLSSLKERPWRDGALDGILWRNASELFH